MIRTQVQLTEDQAARVKRLAAQRGTSIATIIRDALDEALRQNEQDDLWDRAFSTAGMGKSGSSDIGRRHDSYLERDLSA